MPRKSKKVVLKPSKGEELGIKLLQAVKEMKTGKKDAEQEQETTQPDGSGGE